MNRPTTPTAAPTTADAVLTLVLICLGILAAALIGFPAL